MEFRLLKNEGLYLEGPQKAMMDFTGKERSEGLENRICCSMYLHPQGHRLSQGRAF